MKPTEKEQINQILYNALNGILKYNDAPASSTTHFDTAITQLLVLSTNFKPRNEEQKWLVEDAKAHIEYYKGFSSLRERVPK